MFLSNSTTPANPMCWVRQLYLVATLTSQLILGWPRNGVEQFDGRNTFAVYPSGKKCVFSLRNFNFKIKTFHRLSLKTPSANLYKFSNCVNSDNGSITEQVSFAVFHCNKFPLLYNNNNDIYDIRQFLSLSIALDCLGAEKMQEDHKFLHGTLEATIFHATPHTPPSHFNVSKLTVDGNW